MAGPGIRLASAGVPAPQPPSSVRAMLEVIDKRCVSESHPVPLLFVHGPGMQHGVGINIF